MSVPVVFAPLALQPDVGRVYVTLPEGWTIEQILVDMLPDVPDTVLDRVMVTMINGKESARVPRRYWHRVRPHAGTQIIIMIAPGRAAFSLLISIAAIAVANFFAPGFGSLLGISTDLARGILGFGLTALGGLLLNALFPVKKDKDKPSYAVTGWANEMRPDGMVPVVFGTMRYAPPLAAYSYIEVVGDILYNRIVFNWGYGPVELSDMKNGETSLDKYEEIEIEHRYGYPGDTPLTLYTQQMIEEKVGTDLVYTIKRNARGDELPGYDEKPIERTTARDAASAIIILSFPSGLGKISTKGKKSSWPANFRLRIKASSGGWIDKPDIKISAKKFVGMYRAIPITFPFRDAWTIEITRITASEARGKDENSYADACTWVVLQSFRPEYPFNFAKPVALTAIRVKSTYQLNGGLDAFNGIVKRIEPVWTGSAWSPATSKNPAAHALFALRGPALYRPVPDSKIDFDSFAEWYEFCETKGLTYNRVHDDDRSLGEALAMFGAAGRASVPWNGRQWQVIIDRPRTIPADIISPRNSSGISVAPSYFEPPHGYRVQFQDETNKYEPAERIVPWPGHVGSIDITEQIEMPGKTNPDEIWIETRRRQYEAMNRSTVYTATQDGLARTATRGDLVLASRDIVTRAMASARVKAVSGDLVEIDEEWTFETGVDYAISFRRYDGSDTIGTAIVRTISVAPETTNVFALTGTGGSPVAGDLVIVGPAGSNSYRLIVVGIERGKDNAGILTMLPEAAIIDTLTDAEDPPVWNGRVGAEIAYSTDPPLAPRVVRIETGTEGTGDANGLRVYLVPGYPSAVIVASYEVQHRLSGAGVWSGPATGSAGSGYVDVSGYVFGNDVELRSRAISIPGIAGAYGATLTVTIGEDDFELPNTFDFSKPANLLLIL